MKYLLKIAYDGTHYVGWQVQPNGTSIQSEIEGALATFFKERTPIVGSGRTDAGVHAVAQVAHFSTEQSFELTRLKHGLNGILRKDIRIKEVRPISEDFHARYSAQKKVYHYHLWLEGAVDPWLQLYRHRPREKLSLALLEEGAKQFVGKKNFASFANTGSSVKTSIRTLYRLDVVPQEGGVRLEFEGDGFLYKMVRNIAGTLLEIATGKRKLEEIPAMFAAKERSYAGVAAPARGLFLVKVQYDLALLERPPEQISCPAAL